MSDKKHPRVLVFTECKQGFGHFNVTNQLTRDLAEAGANCAIASGSFDHAGASYPFEHAKKFELPSLPKIIVSREESLKNHSDIITRRKQAIKDACNTFKPDIIVFEIYPFSTPSREDDAIACHEWIKETGRKVPVTCLARDIMHSDTPGDVLRQLKAYFSQIFVRGAGDLVKLEDCMPEWKDIPIPVTYTGNIVSPMPARSSPPSSNDPVIVFGGGGYNKKQDADFFANTVKSFEHSGALKLHPWTIYVSENYPQPMFEELQTLAREVSPQGRISIQRPIEQSAFKQQLADCTACITRGGYNVCFELASIKKPFLIIPRVEGDKEQIIRGERMANMGFCTNIPQKEASPETIGEQLARQHAAPLPTATLNTSGGAMLASALIATARGIPLKPDGGNKTATRIEPVPTAAIDKTPQLWRVL